MHYLGTGDGLRRNSGQRMGEWPRRLLQALERLREIWPAVDPGYGA